MPPSLSAPGGARRSQVDLVVDLAEHLVARFGPAAASVALACWLAGPTADTSSRQAYWQEVIRAIGAILPRAAESPHEPS